MRYILIAFGFLALAFYELSGGKGFDPEDTRQAAQALRQDLAEQRRAEADTLIAALPPISGRAPLPATDDVAETLPETSLDLASFSSIVAPERATLPEIAQEEVAAPSETPELEDKDLPDIQMAAPAVIGVSQLPQVQPDSDEDENTIGLAGLSRLPQIEEPVNTNTLTGSTASASSDDVALAEDIRFVSGSRVNLRDGPGLRFDVVGQLDANTRVEVLEDAGNGWVRLRTEDSGTTGWVAEFLLSAR